MTIGQVAKQAGLSASAIRFYEKAGLVPEPPRAGGQRRYDGAILRQLAVLEFAKECGFALAEIRQLFSAFRPNAPLSERLRDLARGKIEALDRQAKRIALMKRLLQRAQTCQCVEFDECSRKIMARGGRSVPEIA